MQNKSDELGVDLDLLGYPLKPIKDPRGRPAYANTKENQMVVMVLAARGWRQAEIATFMGCDEKTLRKHFSRFLQHGALYLEGIALQAMVKKMLAGNIGATRDILDIASIRAPQASDKPESAKAAQLGIKAQREKDATDPPPEWGELLDENVH